MVSQSLLNNTNVQVTSALGGMQVLEYVQDMSVSPSTSKLQYYMSRMNVNKRQLLVPCSGRQVRYRWKAASKVLAVS